MSRPAEPMLDRIYPGIWAILERWLRVPKQPPTLPARPGELVESFRPAPGFLRYLKIQFWLGLVVIGGMLFVGWVALTVAVPVLGILVAPVGLTLVVLAGIVSYVALHLRYDTTWYVMSDRSLRIRRGIWVIHETTITFENVQNVMVHQGPLQRWFGIADVLVETAGGGGHAQEGTQGRASTGAHRGLMEGVADAHRIRDLVLSRCGRSRSAGLGDEPAAAVLAAGVWKAEHLAALREVREAVRALPPR